MKAKLARALVVGTGIAAAGVLTATSAFAHAAPFTVKTGSAAAGTSVAVTGTSGTVSFKDTTTGVTLTCTSAVVKGVVTPGTKSTGTALATITGTTAVFNSCTGPAGLKFKVTGSGTWNINITDSTSGVSKGTISNIRAHVQSTAGPTCGFDVGANTGSFTSSGTTTVGAGTLNGGTFTNSNQQLAVPASNPGSLGLWNVKGSGTNTYCVAASVIKQSDKASFSATFTLKADVAANNPITIT